jgi:mRNA interferase RelE/StbE
MTSPHTRT